MRDVSCKLISTQITSNSIGVQKENLIQLEVPIIKIEDIYADEFYSAHEQGFKPTLRIRISSLNYSNQKELIYMGITYSIIRTQEPVADEIILICERKVNNVENHKSI